MLTSFFRAGEIPSQSHTSASSQPRWDRHFIQPRLKTPLFWCSESGENASQPGCLVACISGEHLVLSCIPRPGFSLPQPADTHQLLPSLALHLPSSLQGLPFFHTQVEEEGVLGPFQPTVLLDCWISCALISPLQTGVRAAQQLPLFCKWDIAETEKKVALHPSKHLGGCFQHTAKAISLCKGYREL